MQWSTAACGVENTSAVEEGGVEESASVAWRRSTVDFAHGQRLVEHGNTMGCAGRCCGGHRGAESALGRGKGARRGREDPWPRGVLGVSCRCSMATFVIVGQQGCHGHVCEVKGKQGSGQVEWCVLGCRGGEKCRRRPRHCEQLRDVHDLEQEECLSRAWLRPDGRGETGEHGGVFIGCFTASFSLPTRA